MAPRDRPAPPGPAVPLPPQGAVTAQLACWRKGAVVRRVWLLSEAQARRLESLLGAPDAETVTDLRKRGPDAVDPVPAPGWTSGRGGDPGEP